MIFPENRFHFFRIMLQTARLTGTMTIVFVDQRPTARPGMQITCNSDIEVGTAEANS